MPLEMAHLIFSHCPGLHRHCLSQQKSFRFKLNLRVCHVLYIHVIPGKPQTYSMSRKHVEDPTGTCLVSSGSICMLIFFCLFSQLSSFTLELFQLRHRLWLNDDKYWFLSRSEHFTSVPQRGQLHCKTWMFADVCLIQLHFFL